MFQETGEEYELIFSCKKKNSSNYFLNIPQNTLVSTCDVNGDGFTMKERGSSYVGSILNLVLNILLIILMSILIFIFYLILKFIKQIKDEMQTKHQIYHTF